MGTPEQEQPPPVQQLSVGLADTPDGQRLTVTVTLLMDAAQAKAFAAVITGAAANMSNSGLIAVGGVLNGNGVR